VDSHFARVIARRHDLIFPAAPFAKTPDRARIGWVSMQASASSRLPFWTPRRGIVGLAIEVVAVGVDHPREAHGLLFELKQLREPA